PPPGPVRRCRPRLRHDGAGRGGAGPYRGASGQQPAARAPRRGARGAMSWLGPVAAAAGRGAVRLVPTARRDWAEAVWAEAHDVPTGWPRLGWRAGGVGRIATGGERGRGGGAPCLGSGAGGGG